LQGQCKLKAESSLYAEAQPVLAISSAKLGVINHENKKNGNARLADTLHYMNTGKWRIYNCCLEAFLFSFSSCPL
jgi:hypothetical protein